MTFHHHPEAIGLTIGECLMHSLYICESWPAHARLVTRHYSNKQRTVKELRLWLFEPTRTLPSTRDHLSATHECEAVSFSEVTQVQTNTQKQAPVEQVALCSRGNSDIKHSGPVYSAGGTFTAPQSKSPLFFFFFFSLFAWNSSQVCNMEQWLLAHGVITVAPLCAGVHGAAGPTLHSWNPLVTAEWPEAGQVAPKQGGEKAQFPLCSATDTNTWVGQAMNESL